MRNKMEQDGAKWIKGRYELLKTKLFYIQEIHMLTYMVTVCRQAYILTVCMDTVSMNTKELTNLWHIIR